MMPPPAPQNPAIRHVVCYPADTGAMALTRVIAMVLGTTQITRSDPTTPRLPATALVVVTGRTVGRLHDARRAGFRGPAVVLAGPGDDGPLVRDRWKILRWHPPAHAVWPTGSPVADLLPLLADAGPIPPDRWRVLRARFRSADRFLHECPDLAATADGRPWPEQRGRSLQLARDLYDRASYASHTLVGVGDERRAVYVHVLEWLARHADGPPAAAEVEYLRRLFADWCGFARESGELIGDPPGG